MDHSNTTARDDDEFICCPAASQYSILYRGRRLLSTHGCLRLRLGEDSWFRSHRPRGFDRAYTPNAKCAPSRSCILTGRNSWQLEEAANHVPFFPEKFTTYVEALGEHGYSVGKTGKGWAPGVVGQRKGKRRQLAGTPFDKLKNKPPASKISSNDYASNFDAFMKAVPSDKPWCFWYGGFEPHRGYEFGAGIKKGGKKLSDIDHVPAYWPDNKTVRTDMLDYAYEIEWFDKHLVRILESLEQSGQLDNTLIIVTADNGMPFPRIKGQEYEQSNHLPLAIRWPKGISSPGRVINDYVSFIDFAPTFLEAAGIPWNDSDMQPTSGTSLFDIFQSDKAGQVNPKRDHVLIGKERHDIGRPHDWGYPIRGIVKDNILYLRNFEPTRWPGGNPETGYLNCDGSPTKTVVLQARKEADMKRYWTWNFGLRPSEEMFALGDSKDCIQNLAGNPKYAKVQASLREQMTAELKAQADARILGNGSVFDKYIYAHESTRGFYQRYIEEGDKTLRAGWVNKSDFETVTEK